MSILEYMAMVGQIARVCYVAKRAMNGNNLMEWDDLLNGERDAIIRRVDLRLKEGVVDDTSYDMEESVFNAIVDCYRDEARPFTVSSLHMPSVV